MGSVDSIPLVSQTKSTVQVLAGDRDGAIETQKNFLNTCPIVSQGKSLYHCYEGDREAGWETQKKFGRNMSNLADGIPGVGHAKGALHYAYGDKDGGDNAMKSASRTVGVIGGGVVGGLVGGPVGAVAGGIAGGAALDGVTTVVDSKVNGGHRPAGLVAAAEKIKDGEASVGEVFDSCAGVVFDGVLGYTAGDVAGKIRDARNNAKVYRVASEAEVQQSVKSGQLTYKKGPNGEVWVTESMEHAKAFSKSRHFENRVIEVEIPQTLYEQQTKAGAIKQQGSRAMQSARAAEGKGPANVWNTEGLGAKAPGKANVGIKGKANLQVFNKHIKGLRIHAENTTSNLSQRFGQSGTSTFVRFRDREKKSSSGQESLEMFDKHMQGIRKIYPDTLKYRSSL